MEQKLGHIILLNGTSSVGKSSITEQLQTQLSEPYLHFQMDSFWQMLPAGRTARDFPNMKFVILESAVIHAQHGHNLILDIVCPFSFLDVMLKKLSPYQPFTVGVKASLETLQAREKERTDRKPGLAESQLSIHNGMQYDFEIDTTNLTAAQSAGKIIAAYLPKFSPVPTPQPTPF